MEGRILTGDIMDAKTDSEGMCLKAQEKLTEILQELPPPMPPMLILAVLVAVAAVAVAVEAMLMTMELVVDAMDIPE